MDLLVNLESSPKVIHCRSKGYSFNKLNNSVLAISTLPSDNSEHYEHWMVTVVIIDGQGQAYPTTLIKVIYKVNLLTQNHQLLRSKPLGPK